MKNIRITVDKVKNEQNPIHSMPPTCLCCYTLCVLMGFNQTDKSFSFLSIISVLEKTLSSGSFLTKNTHTHTHSQYVKILNQN